MSEPDRRAATDGGLPACTLVFVACAVVVELAPASAAWLGFERAAIARGEVWRLLTGHLVHGAARLSLLDLTAFALFGAWVERASRRLFGAVLAASAIVSSLAVLFLTEYERYVGSSALVSGLLAAAALLVLRSSRQRAARFVALTLLGLFAGKVVLELLGAWPAALGGLPSGYQPVAAAHLGGALGGGAVVFALRAERSAF